MRIRLLAISACMILVSGIAFGQTVISESYFPLAAYGGGYTTQVTISRTGVENRIVKIQFLASSATALPITSLTINGVPGAMPNCGPGCFAYMMGSGGYDSIIAVTPGGAITQIGYAKVTVLSPDSSTTGGESVTVAMAFTFAGSTTDEPFLRNPNISFTSPFTDSATSTNGIIVINPQTTTAILNLALYDNADNLIYTQVMTLLPHVQSSNFLSQIFSPMVQSGRISITSSVPVFVWPIRLDMDAQNNFHFVFLNVPNTPVGGDVEVQPADPATGETPVTLTFSEVFQAGNTELSASGTGAPPPTGFKLGTPPTYYEISTTAVFSGPIGICIDYSGISFGNPSKLNLFHFENGHWTNVTVSNDTINGMICGSTSSLSPFAIFESDYTATVQPPINADGTSVFSASRGDVPVKFSLALNGTSTCELPPATIFPTQSSPGSANMGPNFRVDSCQYVYNLSTKQLGGGTYSVQIRIDGVVVGSATFSIK